MMGVIQWLMLDNNSLVVQQAVAWLCRANGHPLSDPRLIPTGSNLSWSEYKYIGPWQPAMNARYYEASHTGAVYQTPLSPQPAATSHQKNIAHH